MKIPKALDKQLAGLQAEIDERKKQAELDTCSAYGILIWLVMQHEEAYNEACKQDPDIEAMYSRLCDRFSEYMEKAGK